VKPYYQDDSVTIYHGDCREILPDLTFDVVITDPPYGINVVSKTGAIGTTKPNKAWSHETGPKKWSSPRMNVYRPVVGDDEPLDPRWLTAYGRRQVIFGADHFTEWPGPGRLLVWDKRDGLPSIKFADCEIAWDSDKGASRLIRHLSNGFMGDFGDIKKCHPTQKPLRVMTWIIDQCTEQTDTVCDPFMGSGTTLRAAKDLGRKAVGIELDESYCEIAVNRLAQGVLNL
tara:strand:+ start:284 stop:970 length:687 start_codon:yes stop_codon:yes gene_type:complete